MVFAVLAVYQWQPQYLIREAQSVLYANTWQMAAVLNQGLGTLGEKLGNLSFHNTRAFCHLILFPSWGFFGFLFAQP